MNAVRNDEAPAPEPPRSAAILSSRRAGDARSTPDHPRAGRPARARDRRPPLVMLALSADGLQMLTGAPGATPPATQI
jgi:hypothetical protein